MTYSVPHDLAVKRSNRMNTNLQTATLAGGCFWCLEAVYDEIKGVQGVESGYAGGHVDNPTYRAVCNGDTGHAEVVQVHFDPNIVSYRDLLNVFFAIHDPTTLNRQGADTGTQYRSAIFYHDDEQKKVAEELIKELDAQKIWDRPLVTQVTKLDKFYMAEDYHQEYFANNPYQPYCMAVVSPKVSKFRKHFIEMLKKQPV
jgi:peptide-methionine (S)-S-oxide reductase